MKLDAELVKAIDKMARSEYATRSEYIRKAIVNQLQEDARKKDLKQLLEDLAEDIADSAIAIDSPYHFLSFKDFVNYVTLQRDTVQIKSRS